MKRVKMLVAMLMIPVFLLMQVSPALTLDVSSRTVYIANEADLLAFAKHCSLDSWSHGRTVILTSDIHLKTKDFTPIPIFGGVFDGGSHTISGLSINVEGSNQGLFRYLEKGGVIKNLDVQGVVTPGGSKSYIGGIVGNNMGTLDTCSFSGYVTGDDVVGGLVGWNGTTGKLINSVANGVLYGKSKVGGIAGANAGTILRCTNKSQVNTTVEEDEFNFEGFGIEDIKLSQLLLDTTDIGGITGLNTGVVQSSENTGTIGYPHVGYNVGGIAGRQSGYISKCVNHGKIYGRKEVAGIVGQMEPHMSATISASKLGKLQKEMHNLQSMITKLLTHVEGGSNVINENLSAIKGNLDDSRAHAESLINQTEILINQDLDEVNRISLIAVEAMDRLIPIIENLTDLMEIMGKASHSFDRSLYYLQKAMAEMDDLGPQYAALEEPVRNLAEAGEGLEESLPHLREALGFLQEGKFGDAIDSLHAAEPGLKAAVNSLEQAVNNLGPAKESMKEIFKTLGLVGKNVEYALSHLNNALEILGRAMDQVPAMLRGVTDLLDYIRSQPELDLATTDDQYQQTKEELFRSIDNMSDSVFLLIDVMNKESHRLIGDIQEISDQLFLIFDLLLGIVEEITESEIDPGEIIKDVSRQDVNGKAEGKVADCKNLGTIEGDVNVGGIAGAMGIELIAAAEEELSIKSMPSLRTAFQSRAILVNCENTGIVLGKKNGIGGIVGNMDLGYITGCVGAGTVESTDGNYVGGVAGKANSAINASYAKATLQGGNYIGGIAGLGQEITNSYSMVTVDRGTACVGAIAGYAENHKVIKNNYFVSDLLAGIDGISYEKKARPITYTALMAVKGLPAIFKKLQLEFWVDDLLVDTIEFNYGDTVSEENLPDIPLKQGHYARWEKFDLTNLAFDRKIKAEYFPYVTVLESKEKRDGPLSIALVEGNFVEEDALTLVESKGEGEFAQGTVDFIEAWNVTIPHDGNFTHTIRVIPPKQQPDVLIYMLQGGEWVKAKVRRDGKYLLFDSEGYDVTFALVKGKPSYVLYWAALGVLLTGALAFVLIRRRKKSQDAVSLDA